MVFPVNAASVAGGSVLTEDDGTVLGVFAPGDQLSEDVPVEVLKGVLVPGFVNTHCHLELSWMKGLIPRDLGMDGFIAQVVRQRQGSTEEQRLLAMQAAEQEMITKGVVAVGDISNNSSSFAGKAVSPLYYHTFIEVFDLHPTRAEEAFRAAEELRNEYLRSQGLDSAHVSINAHAPYTVSPQLHERITSFAREHNSILSIHNQESEAENELFKKGTGKLSDMYARMGLDYSWFKHSGSHSLQVTLPFYKNNRKLLLVHNTFASRQDMKDAKAFAAATGLGLFWAACPNANHYIEGVLPDYPLMQEEGLKLTVGTDSLASNVSLSVFDELKTIHAAYPQIPSEELIRWATLNGAEFLDMDERYGSLEKRKRPGLVLIESGGSRVLGADARARRVI
jgi:cytosine/adenosine deaminase-related metal-dependent hydrolase